MKQKKQVLITFDYELFLGKRSGSVEESIIIPTEKILSILSKFNHKAIFFVDTLYLISLKKKADNLNVSKDYKLISDQLQKIAKDGHEIFLHLHPHWLDAIYLDKENQWDLSNHIRYRLSSFSEEERIKMFADSLEVLKEIIFPVRKDVLFDGYRAGGWCIQPFESFISCFKTFNIKYDFSVLPNQYYFSEAQYFDFRNTPKYEIYTFSKDVLQPDENGCFTEFVISTIKIPSFYLKLSIKAVNRLFPNKSKQFGHGFSIYAKEIQTPVPDRLKKQNYLACALEHLNWFTLPYFTKYLKENKFMQFISHPKMLTQHNIDIFEKFMKKAYSKYEVECDFRKMRPLQK